MSILSESREKLRKRLNLRSRFIPEPVRALGTFQLTSSAMENFVLKAAENGFTWDEQIRRLIDSFNCGQLEDVEGTVWKEEKRLNDLV